MPAVIDKLSPQLPPEAPRKLTREDYRALAEAGLLEWEKFELIDGVLVRKIRKSRLHSIVLMLLVERLRAEFGYDFVEQEVAIDMSPALDRTNELEPDAVVLRRSGLEIRRSNPTPADTLLIAEISVTAQDYDLGAKAARYSIAGMSEYWVLDLAAMRIVVHREPEGDSYRSIIAYALDEPVSPQASPSAAIRLRDLVN